MNNPFTLEFGKEPLQFISRLSQTDRILDSFTSENPASSICMITGVRGSGKTVFMTTIAKKLAQLENWKVIELSPHRDMLNSFAAKLYDLPGMSSLFQREKLDLSAFGIGVHVERYQPVADVETAISSMLRELKKRKERVLVSVDEAANNANVRTFASVYPILLRKEYPIFLLMTGLYENIYNLQNDASLTFLYRAPKVLLEPLNLNAISRAYISVFHLSPEKGAEMARLTMGYPYAFQVLGYLYWENPSDNLEELFPLYDQYLEEYVYEKIWSELSEKDRFVVEKLSTDTIMKVQELRTLLDMSSSEMSIYRNRLIRKGVAFSPRYGYLSLALPRFGEIVKTWTL